MMVMAKGGLALLLCLALGGCGRTVPPEGVQVVKFALGMISPVSLSEDAPGVEFVLGTICSVSLSEDAPGEILDQVFGRLREIDREMSANREDSFLSRVNRNAALEPVAVPADLFKVLERARFFAEASGGYFEPAIGPLVELWAIGTERAAVPPEGAIRERLALADWRDLILDREAGTAYLTRPGMALDLGAIAKGYAADEAAAILREAGITGGIVNLGGNIYALGEKKGPQGESLPWRIGIQDPLDSRGAYIGILEVRDTSVVTSGVYERYFEEGGKRYHHILSIKTGFPVDNGLLSVTIISGSSMDADALSTAVFALGYERGLALVDSFPEVEAVFVFDDLSVRATPGAQARFTLQHPAYHLAD